jgi:hypothetical protein
MLAALVSAGIATTIGCNNDSRLKSGDPLAGGGAPIPTRNESPAATAGNNQRGTVPPMPAPSSSTSTAALAAGGFQPLDPTRDLRIGNGDSRTPEGGTRVPVAGSTAVLNPPKSTTDRAPTGLLTSDPKANSSIQPVGAASGGSNDAVLELLKARGVTWYRVEASPENTSEFKFSCSVPNPNNPNVRRMYEAHGPDQRSAMLAVLKQMDEERR